LVNNIGVPIPPGMPAIPGMMMARPPMNMPQPPGIPVMMTAPPIQPMMTAPSASNVVSAGPTFVKPASTVGQTVAATSAPVLRVPMTNLPLGIGITQVVSAPPTGWTPMVSASGPHPPESRLPLALFVAKIPEKISTETLKRIFEAFGQVVKFIRPIGSNNKPKNCGVVTFAQGIYALRCFQNLQSIDLILEEESKIELKAGTNETNVLKMLDEWEKTTQRTVESDIERALTIVKNILTEPIITDETALIPLVVESEESVAAALSAASELIIDDINYDPTTNPIVMNEIERFRARLASREKEVEAQKLIKINEIITKMEKDAIERPALSKNQESSGQFLESLGFTKARDDDRDRDRDRERERERERNRDRDRDRERDRHVDRARDRNTENASIKRSNESDPDLERANARRRLEVLESLGANTESTEATKHFMSLEAPKKLGLTLKKKTTLTNSGFGVNDDDQVKPMRELITLDDEISKSHSYVGNQSLEFKQQLISAQNDAITRQLAEAMKK